VARLRSIAVVALLWLAAFAGSSAPDGFGGPHGVEMPVLAGAAGRPAQVAAAVDRTGSGMGRAVACNPVGKRWDIGLGPIGKRWEVG
jgi:hypothetical protein